MTGAILPGATIGVLGNGQLGRMLAFAARQMGYRLHVFGPNADSPAGQIADRETVADYDDLVAVRRFARSVDVVTFEFENIPAAAIDVAAEYVPVRPDGRVLHIIQHRLREKTFLHQSGFPLAPFQPVKTFDDLRTALDIIGYPAVLKSAGYGYDGKGQQKIESPSDVATAYEAAGGGDAVLEGFISFVCEISVIGARGVDGSFAHYGAIENDHRNHILDLSISPARVQPEVQRAASEMTHAVMETLGVVGVLCVEFFVTRDGTLLINELAPRPHNSGHLTIEAAATSQFEQQLRTVCGLPLGSTIMRRPAAMVNLLGDIWERGEPDWVAACAVPEAHVHLYSKDAPRPGRKMGHITVVGDTVEDAVKRARGARMALARGLESPT